METAKDILNFFHIMVVPLVWFFFHIKDCDQIPTVPSPPLNGALNVGDGIKITILWNAHYEILWKTASTQKISLKSDNQLLSYGQKTILKNGGRLPSWILRVQKWLLWKSHVGFAPAE